MIKQNDFTMKDNVDSRKTGLLTTHSQLLMTLKKKPFESIVRKEENADNQHFLLLQQCFPLFTIQVSIFQSELFCLLQIFSKYPNDQSRILSFGTMLCEVRVCFQFLKQVLLLYNKVVYRENCM